MQLIQTIGAGKRGGIEQVAEGYAIGFSAIGAPIVTLADIPSELHETFALPHSTLRHERDIGGPWKRWDLPAVLRTRALIRDRGVAACIAHNGHTIDFLRLAAPRGVPMVSVCHMEKLGRRLKADIILCLTDVQRELALKELGGARGRIVEAVGNPLVLPPLGDLEEVAATRLDGKSFVVGTLCNLAERKGLDVLIDAVAKVRGRGFDLNLRLGGLGPLEQALRSQAKRLGIVDAVEFAGWIRDREPYLAGLDLFCLPSRIEPFGLALIEAMSRGLPSVASDTEGPVYITERERYGWLFRNGDADHLADKLQEIITAPVAARAKAVAGARHAMETYGAPAVARRIVDLVDRYRSGER